MTAFLRWLVGGLCVAAATACGSGEGSKQAPGAVAGSGGSSSGAASSDGGDPSSAGSDSDPAAGRPYSLLPHELYPFVALELPNQDVFLYGGKVTRGSLEYPRTAHLYSPSADSFRELDADSSVTKSASDIFAFVTPDGHVLLVEDQTGAELTARRYDLSADEWTELPPAAPAGILDGAVQLPNGDVLVLSLKTAHRIAHDTGVWQPVSAGLAPPTWGALATLADGRVLSVSLAAGPANLFDPESNTWSPVAAPRIARRDASLIGLADGRALLVGGIVDTDDRALRATVQETELYDPETDEWEDGPRLPSPQTTPTLTLLDGDVIAWGGLSFPCDSAIPCGGRAVTRIDVAAGVAVALPEMSAPGMPFSIASAMGDYLVFLSSSYHRYSLESGASKP